MNDDISAYTYGTTGAIYFDGKTGSGHSIFEGEFYDLTVVKEGELITYYING